MRFFFGVAQACELRGAFDCLRQTDERQAIAFAGEGLRQSRVVQQLFHVALTGRFVRELDLDFGDEGVLDEPAVDVAEVLRDETKRHIGASNSRVVGPVQDLDEIGAELAREPRAVDGRSNGLEVTDDDREALAIAVFGGFDELVEDVAVEQLEHDFGVLGPRCREARAAYRIHRFERLVKVLLHRRPTIAIPGSEKADAATAIVCENDVPLAEKLRGEIVVE